MKHVLADIPIALKIALAPLLMALCLFAILLTTYAVNQRVAASIDRVAYQALPQTQKSAQLKDDVGEIYGLLMQSVAYEGAEFPKAQIQQADDQVGQAFKKLTDKIARLKQESAGRPEVAARYAAIESAAAKLAQSAMQAVDLKGVGLGSAAVAIRSSQEAYLSLRQQVSDLTTFEMSAGSDHAQAAIQAVAWGTRLNLAACAAGLLLSTLATWLCVRLITRPLTHAMAIARDLADGRLDAPVAHCAKDTTGQVLAALTDVSTRLNETISGIRTSTAEIETASREIAQGNTDLSERTERTAASLQETASSVTHLASTIEKNTETVGQVKEMASMAAQVAREGGEAVSEVVSSMDDINAQAKRISEIIGVIDGIAFQTNILALNAAVEAARAGEQGRGFAVVAQEVRSLAGRSSVAAKEIRSLIGTSVEQTSAGAEKASRAGHTMQRVVGAIDGVSRLVVEIAAASTQQSRAVVTVRSAIDGIDQSTQQNAALVEQAAAATISLKQQAAELLRAVSIFRTASPT